MVHFPPFYKFVNPKKIFNFFSDSPLNSVHVDEHLKAVNLSLKLSKIDLIEKFLFLQKNHQFECRCQYKIGFLKYCSKNGLLLFCWRFLFFRLCEASRVLNYLNQSRLVLFVRYYIIYLYPTRTSIKPISSEHCILNDSLGLNLFNDFERTLKRYLFVGFI